MPNPLLEMTDLPPFNAIKPEHVEPALDAVLAENRAEVATLAAATGRSKCRCGRRSSGAARP